MAEVAVGYRFRLIRPKREGQLFPGYGLQLRGQAIEQTAGLSPGNGQGLTAPFDKRGA